MAPEVVRREVYSKGADVYCYALVLYELLVHNIPFDSWQAQRITSAVAFHGQRPTLPPGTPAPIKALIESCWRHIASERPSFTSVQQVKPAPCAIRCLRMSILSSSISPIIPSPYSSYPHPSPPSSHPLLMLASSISTIISFPTRAILIHLHHHPIPYSC